MQITITTPDGEHVFPIEVDGSTSFADIKAICEAETGLPSASFVLIHQSRPILDSQTPASAGVQPGDMLILVQPAQLQQQQQQQQQRQRGAAAAAGGNAGGGVQGALMQRNADGSLVNPAAAIQAFKADRGMMDTFRAQAPRLYDAIMNDDVGALQEELRRAHRAQHDANEELERLYRLQEEDPFNPELQAKIEDAIRRKNIDENYEAAMEHNPENFISVHMLYVEMEVNGVHVKAFIDSGAQMTIMTAPFAEKCHLTRLLDDRFKGMAVGVGSSKILGKIHQAKMKVGNQVVTTSITVLEQKTGPQFIFGLDMLRRHQCCIDLAKGVLRIGSCGVELPFLSESQIPSDFSAHVEDVSEAEANRRMESDAAAARDNMDTDAGTSATGAAPAPASQPAAAPAPAPAAAAAPAPAAAAPGGGGEEAKIAQLMALGADRNTAIQALRAANGQVEMAASLLFEM